VAKKSDGEYSHLAALLGNREDGIDTFVCIVCCLSGLVAALIMVGCRGMLEICDVSALLANVLVRDEWI
jgi:hypothetical protein